MQFQVQNFSGISVNISGFPVIQMNNNVNTGFLTGLFYPYYSNPAGYVTSSAGGTALQVTGSFPFLTGINLTGISGTIVTLSGGYLLISSNVGGGNTNVQITGSSTLVNADFSGISGITVVLSGNYVLLNTVALQNQLTNIINQTGGLTGQFYPLYSNPAGYLTGISSSAGVTNINGKSGVLNFAGLGNVSVSTSGQTINISGNTGNFITNNSTGTFARLNSSNIFNTTNVFTSGIQLAFSNNLSNPDFVLNYGLNPFTSSINSPIFYTYEDDAVWWIGDNGGVGTLTFWGDEEGGGTIYLACQVNIPNISIQGVPDGIYGNAKILDYNGIYGQGFDNNQIISIDLNNRILQGIWNIQTGLFITNSSGQTPLIISSWNSGNSTNGISFLVQNSGTGILFYIDANGNVSGNIFSGQNFIINGNSVITSNQTGNFITNGQTGIFVTTGQTGGFVGGGSNIQVTGSNNLSSVNFTGVGQTTISLSGNYVLISGMNQQGVSNINGKSGVLNFAGQGNVSVSTNGQTINISGNTGIYSTFVTTGQTGSFGGGGSFNTGTLVGTFALLNSGNVFFNNNTFSGNINITGNAQINFSDGANIQDGKIYDANGDVSQDWNNRLFYDNSDNISIDYQNRRLWNASQVFMDWSQGQLYYPNIGSTKIDWINSYLYDNTNNENYSIDWGNRWLYDTSQNISTDWNNRILSGVWNSQGLQVSGNNVVTSNQTGSFGGSSNTGILTGVFAQLNNPSTIKTNWTFTSGQLNFIGNNTNGILLSGNNAYLQCAYGTSYTLGGTIIDHNAILSVDPDRRYLWDAAGYVSLDYENRFLYDSSNIISIDYSNRLLYDVGGTQPTVDYSNCILQERGLTSLVWFTANGAIPYLNGQWNFTGLSGYNLWSSSGIFTKGLFISGNSVVTGGPYLLTSLTGQFITTGQTGNFGGNINTGILTGVFYPLHANPSGYITGLNTGSFITSIQTGLLVNAFYPLNNNPNNYITSSQTGIFVTTGQTGIFATTINLGITGSYLFGLINASSAGVGSLNSKSGALTLNGAGNVSIINSSQIITVSGNTGIYSTFITTGQTGNFITSSQTGIFYTNDNPSGFITGLNTGNFITSSQTGIFYTNDNPSGFITGLNTGNFIYNGFSGNLSLIGTADGTGLSISGGGFNMYEGIPTVVGVLSGLKYAGAGWVRVVDRYAYMTADSRAWSYSTSGSGLSIIDVSNPSNPILISQINVSGYNGIEGIDIVGKYAYITNYVSPQDVNSTGISIIDISNPTGMFQVGFASSSTLVGAEALVVRGGYAYTATSNGTSTDYFNVIDISNPFNPIVVGSTGSTNLHNTAGMQIKGKYAYVNAATAKLLNIIDVSNPTNPIIVGKSVTLPVYNAYGVKVDGKYAYIASSTGISVIDVSNPLSQSCPIVGSVYVSGASMWTLEKNTNYLYVTDYTNNCIRTFNVSNPLNPYLISTLTDNFNLNHADDIYCYGNYLYCASSAPTGRLTILKIGGLDVPGANIGNVFANEVNVGNRLVVGGDAKINDSLSVGPLGIYSQGNLAVLGSGNFIKGVNVTGYRVLTTADTGNFISTPTSDYRAGSGAIVSISTPILFSSALLSCGYSVCLNFSENPSSPFGVSQWWATNKSLTGFFIGSNYNDPSGDPLLFDYTVWLYN